MDIVIEQINSAGKMFVEFAWPMLWQSSVLIAILLAMDFMLRRKVRAVFRYWLWMLVLAKLFLPTTLSSPVSIGLLTGNTLPAINIAATEQPVGGDISNVLPHSPRTAEIGEASVALHAEAPIRNPAVVPAASLTRQGGIFLVWLMVVCAMLLLLMQRAVFVCGLVRQSAEATGLMNDALKFCCNLMGVRQTIGLKVSPNATSPAVCGLFRPVILVPQGLGSSLGIGSLRVVLMHELAHIKRGDLWVNLLQTLLQIAYFYNPLLWLANWVIRRVREQAVDEAVQVALGDRASQYPETLLNVARLAFERPALSLRLIGVVESKSALTSRIKRMLTRPIPKTAKLGIIGSLAVVLLAVVLLPMAKAEKTGGQTMDEQSRGEEIVKRMAEVNRYWLIGPPVEVKNYSYDFALYQGETKTFKVSEPSSADRAIRQGITYDSLLHKLAKEPFAATYTSIEEVNGIIRTDFKLKESIQIRMGNGLRGRWYGSFNQPVEGGTFWIDAKKMFPVRTKCNEAYEYFSDYAAVDETHYVPLRVKIDENDMPMPMHLHFDWTFKLHKPGLWLFDESHYFLDGHKPVVAASISNVRVNEDSSAGSDSVQKTGAEIVDVAVESFDIRPYSEGGLYSVFASIRNKGESTSPKFRVYFYKNDPERKKPMTHEAGPIKPGNVWNEGSMPFALQEGANEIAVLLDPDNTLGESDRTNNEASIKVVVKDGKIVDKKVSLSSAKGISKETTGISEPVISAAEFGDTNGANAGKDNRMSKPEQTGAPVVVKTTPEIFANDVSPELDKLAVTFNQQMTDKSWSWVRMDIRYPETTGQPYYDNGKKTCSLPVKLKAGQAYLVAFNVEPYLGFVNSKGKPAKPYVLVFATKDKDGKPTPIPEELIVKAKSINDLPQEMSPEVDKAESVPYTQITYNDIRTDGTILFKNTIREINRSNSEITSKSFINSDFVHVTGMSDDEGRALEFKSTHDGDIYRYEVTFNKPIPPGQVVEYVSEGTIDGLVKPVAGNEKTFQYYMKHWPAAGQPTRRIETYLLPAGAELISTTPEDIERKTKYGRIELHVEKMIPPDGSITTSFQYRVP